MDTIKPGRCFGLWVIFARILNHPQEEPFNAALVLSLAEAGAVLAPVNTAARGAGQCSGRDGE